MTPQLARRLLSAALVLGVLANWLVNVGAFRAGFSLWVVSALGAGLLIMERSSPADAARRGLFGAAAALACLLVLRDAPSVSALNFAAFLVVAALIAWRALKRPLMQLEPRDALIGAAATIVSVVAGAPTLALRDAAAASLGDDSRRAIKGFGFGTVVAVPVLLIVTGLLASADPLFAGFVDEASIFLDVSVVEDIMFIGLATWATAGAFRASVTPLGVSATTLRGELRLPFAAAMPLLGGLALLLSAWIGLQVRTLFGGAAYVADTAGMTVATYARNGFFELVLIAGIVLAALLVADDVLDRGAASDRASLRTLGQVLIGLVGAVLVSAVVRLSLYVEYFGLTDDRLIALTILLWVALMLIWFGMTVLRGVRARFAPGVLVISALWLVALNVVNLERIVVVTNVARAERGLEFDVAYHSTLSADALPALLAATPRLPADQATALRAAIADVYASRATARPDWRTWSVPYARGRTLLR
jgi:hypothetical protein